MVREAAVVFSDAHYELGITGLHHEATSMGSLAYPVGVHGVSFYFLLLSIAVSGILKNLAYYGTTNTVQGKPRTR